MNSQTDFQPLFPAHAIERCSATINFVQELPEKALQRIRLMIEPALRHAGLEPKTDRTFALQLDVATGQVRQLSSGAGVPLPVVFANADRSTALHLTPKSITLQTSRYLRWQPFAGQIEALVMPMVRQFIDVVSISNLQLEYLDRFIWTGTWHDLQWQALLQQDSGLIAHRATQAGPQWHTHTGWFESRRTGMRRLVNVNIDIVEVAKSGGTRHPSVGILTMMRDEVMAVNSHPRPELDDRAVQDGLEELHNDLKTLLRQIIVPRMADRIGLQVSGDSPS